MMPSPISCSTSMNTNQPQLCSCPSRTRPPIHMISITIAQTPTRSHATTETGDVPTAEAPVLLVCVCAVMKKTMAEIAATTHAPMYQRVVTLLLTWAPPAVGRSQPSAPLQRERDAFGDYAAVVERLLGEGKGH